MKDKSSRAKAVFMTALAVSLLLWSTSSIALSIENVTFADSYDAGDIRLILHGAGLLRYRLLFKGYVAALYMPAKETAENVLRDIPKRLELSYFASIAGPAFGKAAEPILRKNVSATELARIRERIDRINSFYRDVKPGDRYALTYLPGKGTELSYNGKPLVTIEGADFAAAYFSIWLGKHPIDNNLKEQLLKQP